jgi:hypothetical protein
MPKPAKEPPMPKAIPPPKPPPAPKPEKEPPIPKEPPMPKAAPAPKEPPAPKLPKELPLPNPPPALKAVKGPSMPNAPGPIAPKNAAGENHPPGPKEGKLGALLDKEKGDFENAKAKGEAEVLGKGKPEVRIYSSSCHHKGSNLTQSQGFQSHSNTQSSHSESTSSSASHTSSFMDLTDAQKFNENWMPLQGKEDHKCGSMFDSKGRKFDGWMSAEGDLCDKEGKKLEGKACEMFDPQGEQVHGWMKEDGVFCNEFGQRMEGLQVCDSEGNKIEPMRKDGKGKKVRFVCYLVIW